MRVSRTLLMPVMLVIPACASPTSFEVTDTSGGTDAEPPRTATPTLVPVTPLTEQVAACASAAVAAAHQIVCLRDGEAIWIDEALAIEVSLGNATSVDAVATDDLPWVRVDDAILEVDAGAARRLELGLPVPVTEMTRAGGSTWLSGAGRLFEVQGSTIVEVSLSSSDVISAFAASPTHLYVATPQLIVLRRDIDGLTVESTWPEPVTELALDASGTLWTLADGIPSVWADPSAPTVVELSEPIRSFAAHGPWLVSDTSIFQVEDRVLRHHTMDTTGTLGADARGRLLQVRDGTLLRHSMGRPVVVPDLPAPLEVTEEVLLLPSDPESVTALAVHVDDTPIEVLTDPWRARLDPEALAAGDGMLRIFTGSELGNHMDVMPLWVGTLPDVAWEDIARINDEHCIECHGGDTATRLETNDDWRIHIEDILEYVNSGEMPLGDERLSSEDIVTIRAWKHGGFQ